MTGFRPNLSLRGAKRRGAQGSAACGGVKRPQRLGRHLPLHKRSAGQRLSANPGTASLQLLRLNDKAACRYNPQSASLTAPCRGGTRGYVAVSNHPQSGYLHCQLSIINCQFKDKSQFLGLLTDPNKHVSVKTGRGALVSPLPAVNRLLWGPGSDQPSNRVFLPSFTM